MLRRRVFYHLFRTMSRVANEKVDISKNYVLEKEHIDDVIKVAPVLSSATTDLWQQSHEVFRNHGVNTKDFLLIITGNPPLLSRNPVKVIKVLEAWRNCQFGEKNLYQLITRYPDLLDINNDHKLLERISFLRNYVINIKNVWKLLMNTPSLINDNKKAIEEKFAYLMEVMRIEVAEIVKSQVFSRSLNEIKCRHVFLVRLGMFKSRSPKANAHEPSKNPRLNQIMDTSDNEFSVKVAGVTLAEFEVFQELFSRELEGAENKEEEEEE